MKKTALIILFVLVLGAVVTGVLIFDIFRSESLAITNFTECVAAGNPVAESHPRQCTADGKTFVEDIGNELEKQNLIRLESPRPNELVKSPLTVKGEARGYWFFEASFPVILKDGQGKIIAEVPAQAKGDWMTTEFVPFEATLTFPPATCLGVAYPCSVPATLVLKKDNPSGVPEHDDALTIPIRFSE